MIAIIWFNVWSPTFDAYLKMQSWRLRIKLFYLIGPWTQVWRHFWLINIFENWATYVITCWRFMLAVVRSQISRRLTFMIVSLRSRSSLRKPIFALLQVLLAVSSLIHYNVVSSWRFTFLIMSILNEFAAFSILGQKGGDLTQSYDKSPYTHGNVKRAVRTQTTPQKSSIKQRLRTDLGRSVGVTTATQLVWLTGLREVLYVIQAKSRSRTQRYTWCKCKWQKHNVTSRRVITHRCSETDGLRHNLHFLKVILWTYFDK